MSKTDKTRPEHVRALDLPRYLVAEHDHRTGGCDLPEVRRLRRRDEARTRCTWERSTAFWHDPQNWCGCPMCTDQAGRKAKRRQERRQARAFARDGWRGEN